MPIFSSEAGDLGCATALTSISLVGKTWLTACVFISRLTFPPWGLKQISAALQFFYPARPVLPVRWFGLEAPGAAILVAAREPNAYWRMQLKKVRIAFT
jgi:hypothetical protein